MAAPREVCKICYNSTSHKPIPTLTFEPKAESDKESGRKICSVCRQEWAPIRVAKELSSSRWVRIRPRPKLQIHIDFMLCKNLKKCPRGQDCSYAHSKAELWAWNQERQKEPRPAPQINGSYQYQLCKYMIKSGNCPYGIKCTFAHNEDELQCWLKVQGPVVEAPPTYRCNVCQLKCNSKKQLEEHINSSRHRQQHHLGVGGPMGYIKNNFKSWGFRGNESRPHPNGEPRPRPTLSIPVAGFRLCVHVQNGRRCVYGDYCTFAHSQSELDLWNQLKKHTSVPSGDQDMKLASRDQDEQQLSPVKPSLEISEEFSLAIRTRLSKEFKQNGEIPGLEVTKEDISIQEISGTPLGLKTSNFTPIHWVFEISSKVHSTLYSVVLFDPLTWDFKITEVIKCTNAGQEKVAAQSYTKLGMLINLKIVPSVKIQVKVTMVPRSGRLGQLIVFHFDSFHLVQSMVVQVIGEREEKLLNAKSNKANNLVNVDLYWENKYKKIAIPANLIHETIDKKYPEYPLPKQIEDFIESGKYSNVDSRVTKDNYIRRMHNLLYLEEFQQKSDLSRYDLYDVEVSPETHYSTRMGTNYAESGYYFITVAMDEILFEGGQSVRHGDGALLLPSNQKVMHECFVEHVGRDKIILKITDKAEQASASSRYFVSIRFVLDRVTMRSMHYAVDHLDLDTIFPVIHTTPTSSIPTSVDVQKCLENLKDSELNPPQLQALTSVLDTSCLKIPSLVLGPFGCGKTRTLTECIKLLATHMTNSKVLVCTHSNSAADIYVENLDSQWKSEMKGQSLSLFRLVYVERRLNTISPCVRKYCKIVGEKCSHPSLAELKTHRIVVSTLSTSRELNMLGLPKGHFTHIFIDEAAQALESEALIPLCLADSDTKIVLAGDHMQLDPPVYSKIARKYGLHVSLLERLFDLEAYSSGIGQLCKTILTENHRSHQLIMDLPSQLFYKNKLSCKAVFPQSGPVGFPAVKFVSVEGVEQQDEDSPSYYNVYETDEVTKQTQLLVTGGLEQEQVCVLSYYFKQVQFIRHSLRKKRLGKVQVERVDNVQGKEFRALIISTVRTCSTELILEREAGFLTNPKLFNTAVTRARQWLIVVGEPVTLCTIGSNRLCWLEYIRRCIGLNSFEHPHPSQFEESLDFKLVTRQMLEKIHPNFFASALPKCSTSKTIATSTFEVPMHDKERTVNSRQGEEDQVVLVEDSDSFASKVSHDSCSVEDGHTLSPPRTPPRIITAHSKITRSPLNGCPDHITSLKDLPHFLKSLMESVTSHENWCDKMLARSYPPNVASKISDNLKSQKSVLEKQRKLVNQQIHFYRNYTKLEAKMSNHHLPSSEACTKQHLDSSPLTFPSALPSMGGPHSFSESMGDLNSAFICNNGLSGEKET